MEKLNDIKRGGGGGQNIKLKYQLQIQCGANLAFINDLNVTSPLQCIKGHDHCTSSRSSLYAEGRPGKQHKLSLDVGRYLLYIAPHGLWCLICKILTFINVNIAIICRYINYQYILSIYRALQEPASNGLSICLYIDLWIPNKKPGGRSWFLVFGSWFSYLNYLGGAQ